MPSYNTSRSVPFRGRNKVPPQHHHCKNMQTALFGLYGVYAPERCKRIFAETRRFTHKTISPENAVRSRSQSNDKFATRSVFGYERLCCTAQNTGASNQSVKQGGYYVPFPILYTGSKYRAAVQKLNPKNPAALPVAFVLTCVYSVFETFLGSNVYAEFRNYLRDIRENNDKIKPELFDVLGLTTSAGVFGTALADLSGNLVFTCAFLSWLTAQMVKYFTAFYREGKWDWRVMFDSGGMPSSHTALVVGLTTAIAYQYGLGSTLFPLSLAFSLIVMYDAAGVRRHAGKQAEVLNRILDDMFHGQSISERKLKEVLGHSPLQVLAGAALGVFIGILYTHKFGAGYASLA